MNLFEEEKSPSEKRQLGVIPGLLYQEAFLTPAEESTLLQSIDQQEWLGDLTRRVQHYSYKYDYKARRIDLSMRIGGLPA